MRMEGEYNWTDGIPAEGRNRLKTLLDLGKTIAIAYETQAIDGESSIQHCFGYKSLKSYCIDGSIIHEDVFLNAVLGKMWFLDPSPRLGKDAEMQLLNLAIAYGDADYQQKDGADRAWHHVAEAREKLIAFVENREPNFMTNTRMEARLTEDLGEQTLAHIIISAEKLGMEFMGDQMIGFKIVGGSRESRRVWNLIIGKVIPDGFEFTDDFFECYGIQPIPYESQKWNEQYETRF